MVPALGIAACILIFQYVAFEINIDIRWFYFVIPVLIMLFVSLVTTGSRIMKTANMNPAESLRYE